MEFYACCISRLDNTRSIKGRMPRIRRRSLNDPQISVTTARRDNNKSTSDVKESIFYMKSEKNDPFLTSVLISPYQ